MRPVLTFTCALSLVLTLVAGLVLPGTAAAEVILRPHDPDAPDAAGRSVQPSVPSRVGDDSAGLLGEKLDEPADILLVPFYDVDTVDPNGTTTLFAVRNTTISPLGIELRYLSPGADILRQDLLTLDPRETLTRNIRDVSGLPVGMDGFTRGYVAVLLTATPPSPDNLVGDYLQVDVANNFATAERMVSFRDLCDEQEIRFIDFGAGTELRVLVNNPRGTDLMTDPPTMVVRPFDETGGALPVTEVYTTENALRLLASDFTSARFGTLVFELSNGGGGLVYGEYSAGGRFSVGLNSACTVP
jgi:hypothetical protein